MKKTGIIFCCGVLAVPALALSQERDRPYDDGNSWMPFASSGYLGGGAGESTYNGDCLPAIGCERHETGYRAQIGGRIRDMVGIELGYIDFGTIQRNGGETRGNGAIADVTLNAPLGQYLSVFAKGGGTYGWTRTTSALPLVATGHEQAFNWNYGAGVNLNFTANWAVDARWERHRMDFAGGGENLDLWSAGLNYRF